MTHREIDISEIKRLESELAAKEKEIEQAHAFCATSAINVEKAEKELAAKEAEIAELKKRDCGACLWKQGNAMLQSENSRLRAALEYAKQRLAAYVGIPVEECVSGEFAPINDALSPSGKPAEDGQGEGA